MWIDVAGGQPLDIVELGEFAGIVRRRVGHEFLMRLLAKVAGIDEKQDAFGATKLEQTVNRCDGGENLAGTGGHVDKGARFVLCQRLLQASDGVDLALAQVACRQLRHLHSPAAQGVGLSCPVGKRLWLEEMKQLTGAGQGIGSVSEPDDLAGSLVKEAE